MITVSGTHEQHKDIVKEIRTHSVWKPFRNQYLTILEQQQMNQPLSILMNAENATLPARIQEWNLPVEIAVSQSRDNAETIATQTCKSTARGFGGWSW